MMGDVAAWCHAPTMAWQSASNPGLQTLTGAERLLWEASERALRQPRGRLVLVLHLSRLTPPAPRSYHIRIARVLMQDSAARFDGQVFTMRNQDLVMLCRQAGSLAQTNAATLGRSGRDEFAASPESLPAMLGRLFSVDADSAELTSLWRLESDAPSLLGYLTERAGGAASADVLDEQGDATLSAAALQGILAKVPLGDLMRQQTGMSLDNDRGRTLTDRLVPAFRELDFSLAALNLGPVATRATADPFLFRHLATGLDARMPIHLNLSLETILSPAFTRLSRQAAAAGVRLGASVSLMQACADLDLMDHARRVLTSTGAELVLTHVDPIALAMIRPAKLRPNVMKIVWSPLLLAGSPAEQRASRNGLLDGVDLAKVVLQNADSQNALAWGKAQGISLFQGAFIDNVQAATRMTQCLAASGCTMRQCGARANSVSIAGRAGCSDPALLDAAPLKAEHAVLCS